MQKYMMNEYEIIYFAGFLHKIEDFNIPISELKDQAQGINDFLNIIDIKDNDEYKALLLFFMFSAYAIKVNKNSVE